MKIRLIAAATFLLLIISNSNVIAQELTKQNKDSIVQFVFTSDVHFGLTKEKFRGKLNVPAIEVNKAMVAVMNQMQGETIPMDGGVQSNQVLKGMDALVITGDIANRMEVGIQTATKSWEEFKTVFIDSLHLLKANTNAKAALFVVPGNHDMSNAIGFHRPMQPKKDPASMLGIYNLMFPQKQVLKFDSSLNRVHYSKDIKNVHFIFLSLYPDSAERVWMEQDLKKVSITTPVLLFAHSIPEVEPRFFENPNGIHDINEEDKFENLVPERYKDGKDVKGETTIEQIAFTNFVKKHPNIKVYFHGHENFTQYYTYQGPNKDINLQCIRTDSPMKGRASAKDESKLAFELVSINTNTGLLTVREVLWNANANSNKTFQWGISNSMNIKKPSLLD
jgi:predicted MPP superfamily phosphohydrolase